MRSAFLYTALSILVVMAGIVVYAAWTTKDPVTPSSSVVVAGSGYVASPDPRTDELVSWAQTVEARGTIAIILTPTKVPPKPIIPSPTPIPLCSEVPRQSMACDPRTPRPTDTPTPRPEAMTPIVPCLTVEAEVASGVREYLPHTCMSQWTPTP